MSNGLKLRGLVVLMRAANTTNAITALKYEGVLRSP